MAEINCQSCKYYKDGYCKELELKPHYPEKACDYFSRPKFGEWIPVSERLPEESDGCLCCDKDGYMTIGGISKWSKEWYFDDDEINIDVAWWMPLPEPPYKAERK